MMGNKTKILVIVPALILSIGLALPAFRTGLERPREHFDGSGRP